MLLDNKIKTKIQKSFAEMQKREDLLDLLNFVKLSVIKGYNEPFSIQQLNYYSFPSHAKKKYKYFTIPKKSGGNREINAPTRTLKTLQKTLNVIFQCLFTPHGSATGFVLNKSIVDNASIHTGNNYVLNIDLKDFFTSIEQARIWACLKNPPFSLNDDRQVLANIIASLCCTELQIERKDEKGEIHLCSKNVLPQGAPTSPTLSNIVAQRLDYQLWSIAKRFNLKYSRYADDITFSSMHNVYQIDSDFIKELRRVITAQNFEINEKKVRLIKRDFKQEVTGLIVNKKVNISQKYIKQIRMWLYLWETYGYNKANICFLKDYKIDKGYIKQGIPNFENVLHGKLDYLKMVVGSDSKKYKLLQARFDKLNPTPSVSTPNLTMITTPIFEKPAKKTRKHKPKQTLSFLKLFDTSKGIKFLTHDWNDNDFNREKLILTVRKEFEDAKKQYSIPNTILSRFQNFAFEENPKWFIFENGIKHDFELGWSSKKIIEWCNNPMNKGISPFRNYEFLDKMIMPFKHSIEIRKGDLPKILEYILKEQLKLYNDFNITMSVKNAQFYTEVEEFVRGLRCLFKPFSDIAKSNNCYDIDINYVKKQENDLSVRVITITHKNSRPGKSSNDDDLLKGDLKEAKAFFTGLCNWSIEAEFEDGMKRVDLLNDNKVAKGEGFDSIDIIKEEKGFTHILSFYS